MNQSASKLWTKDFIIVSLSNFFMYLVFYLLLVTMATFAVNQYNATESQAGLVTGIFIIGTLIGRLFIGRLITRIGNKKVLYTGLALFVLASFLYFMNGGLVFLLFTRFLHGIALGIASTATGTIVAEVIPPARRGEGIGYYTLSVTLATAMGPFLGLYLSQHTTYQMILMICLGFGIISLVTAFFINIPNVPQEKKTNQRGQTSFLKLSNFLEVRVIPIGVIIAIVSIGYSSVLSFINFYAIEVQLVDAASFFFVFYAVAILGSRPFTGRLMDKQGANWVMYPAFILFSIGFFLLSIVQTAPPLLIAGFLMGLGYGNMQSIIQALAVKLTPSHRLGLATSTYYIAMDAGLGFGPYLIGFIIPLTGYSNLYLLMGIGILITMVLYYFLHGKKDQKLMDPSQQSEAH